MFLVVTGVIPPALGKAPVVPSEAQKTSAVVAPIPHKATVKVHGMVCSFCAQSIEKNLKKNPAVAAVKVDLDNKTVVIDFKKDQQMSDKDIAVVITDEAGYTIVNIAKE